MTPLKISEHILELRHKKGITQEELAAFLGVTKASVSKWETKQSYPDILLLPQIAAFFDISIDELMGYEPQLSPEQIKKCYVDLAADFAELPFEEVMEKSKVLTREYYSCYPLLFHMAILWINHVTLAPDAARQMEIVNDIIDICDRISKESREVGLCSDAIVMKAMAELQMGKTQEVIEVLEPLNDPDRLRGGELLIQAYFQSGNISKANRYSQILLFSHLLGLVENSIMMIGFNMENREFCETTIERVEKVAQIYELDNLHPNTVLQFYYQSAVFYCACEKKEEALKALEKFVYVTIDFLKKGITLHGDSYFCHLDDWFEEITLNKNAPRNEKVVWESLIPALENPAFSILFKDKTYKYLKKQITESEV